MKVKSVSKLGYAAIAGVLLLAAAPRPARAWVQVCNKTTARVWVSYEFRDTSCSDGSGWSKLGWWGLSRGECKIIYGKPPTNAYSYFYAEADNGWVWNGPFTTCTPYENFDQCDTVCSPGSRRLGYRQVYSTATNNTIELVPP